MSLVDKLKKVPFEDAYDKASGLRKKGTKAVKKGAKAAVKPISERFKKVKSDLSRTDKAIFGGKGLRKNIRTLKKDIKSGGKSAE